MAMVLDVSTLTTVHTLLSLIALATGIPLAVAFVTSKAPGLWTAVYLVTSIATSVTGFAFPFETFGPSHWVGVFSLVVLAIALLARYVFHYVGAWRWIYATAVIASVYFLVFVGIAQAFMKIPALHALAPTLSEPPFALSQAANLCLFVILAIIATLRFRRASGSEAKAFA
jgi:hypothetical protein